MNPSYPAGAAQAPDPTGPECPRCDSTNMEEVEDELEDTDGRFYVWSGWRCIDCGRYFS